MLHQEHWLHQLTLPIEVVNIIRNYYYRKDNYPFWYSATIAHSLELEEIRHEIMTWKESFPIMKPYSLRKFRGLVMGGYKVCPDMYESPPLYVQIKTLQLDNYVSKRNITSWTDMELYTMLLYNTD